MRSTFPASAACAAALLAGCGAAAMENPGGGRWSGLNPPASAHRAVVWAVGDGADGGPASRRVARRIARGRPDWLLYLGDVYKGNNLRQYSRHYGRVYGRFTKITAPTPGNHEWPRHRSGYDRYWGGLRGTRPPAYYAFSLGGWRIVSLNSEVAHGNRSRQLRWLRRLLRRNSTNCTIALWHRPLHSAGTHGDQRDVAPFWNALRGHAVLILNGHDHHLQRHRPRDGIVELVAGAGGHDRYPVDRSYPGLAFGDARHYGALRLVLRRGRASFAFVSSGGRKLDAGRVRCR